MYYGAAQTNVSQDQYMNDEPIILPQPYVQEIEHPNAPVDQQEGQDYQFLLQPDVGMEELREEFRSE